MLNTCDYLIPFRFASLILQSIFSISAMIAYVTKIFKFFYLLYNFIEIKF